MHKFQIGVAVLILAGAAWLTTLVDDGLGLVWTHNVVRNWDQYGFSNLHGKMVFNPGGFQADTQPQVYPGHRPFSLYPFFLTQKLMPGSCSTLFYYALVGAVVLVSIWQLLGRTDRAFWLGIVTVISPGYLLWQSTLDPNLAAAMAGFPFAAAVLWLVQREKLNLAQAALLFGLILLYSVINWTTVFIHALLFVTLWLLPKVPRKNLILYTMLGGLSGMAVVGISLMDKMQDGHGGHVGLSAMFQSYGWGNAGYGLDLGTKTAFTRLLVVNAIGLLPVIAFLGWQIWHGRKSGRGRGLLFLLPLLVSILEVGTLRNYFGHHPWMSCNFILLGMILSFVVWKSSSAAASDLKPVHIKPFLRWTGLAVALAYGFTVLLFYHVHNGEKLALMKLIRDHTPRSAVILISRNTDPWLADTGERLQELFDRRVVVVDQVKPMEPALVKGYLLTAEKNSALQLAADSDDHGVIESLPLMKPMLHLYSRFIAHRRAGDKLAFGEQYYLYH